MPRRAIASAVTTLLAFVVPTPAALAVGTKYFSGVAEYISTASSYYGFRHHFQHRSLGAPGGTQQTFEIQCGTNSSGDTRYVNNNVLALLDPGSVPDSKVEMLALYYCGTDGVFHRETKAIASAYLVEFASVSVPFSDLDVEHDYQVLHTHSSTQHCGSQPAAKAWFFFLDDVKFTCFGFQSFISGTSAPHSYEGEYFMETNDGTAGAIIARHHYFDEMRYSRTGAVDGSGWSVTNYDLSVVDPPASGHGDGVAPRDWWHACFNQMCSS